ncbi:MAG: DNA replication/repair protein RecF [Pseudomonadota bacterium]
MTTPSQPGGAETECSALNCAVMRLRLAEFRNYSQLDLQLDARPVCLFGENGAGKTNLAEAVSFLGPGRGLRGAGADAIRRRQPGDAPGEAPGEAPVLVNWAVFAEAMTPDGPVTLATGADPANPARRKTRLDGAAATQSELARILPMMWLTPREDRLWAGARSDRLRFFDRLVLAGEPGHGAQAAAYEKSMRQRQRLLEGEAEGRRADPDWLTALEIEMAGAGVALAAARLDALVRLQGEIDARPASAFPKADIALEGEVEAWLAESASAAEAEERFARTLQDARRRDAATGRTLSGPHRTELAARHRDKDQRAADCSTGEQKSLVVGLALAQAAALARARDRAPILILDEACAHLDAARREGLAEALLAVGGQAWLTGVDRALFTAFGQSAQFIRVNNAIAEPA